MKSPRENILILDNIRSTHNVGAIFRTADAAGISKIYLIGITPTPLDRFDRPRPDIAKASLGAEKTISWEYVKTIKPLITKLKKSGFQIIAIEQDSNAVDYKKVKPTNKNVFVVGNEVDGISKSVLKQCDIVAELPMKGKKESLNVSVTTGIALFRILNI